jgi:hypothetical protein
MDSFARLMFPGFPSLLALIIKFSIKSRSQKIEMIVGPGETEISDTVPFRIKFGDN